jgi:coenzyme F420 hydrogenase subunit beta
MSATEEIIKTNNLDIQDIKKIQYRGNGWPGWFSILSKNNKIIFKQEYIKIWNNILCKDKYQTKRCLLCNDATGEHADISVGDAWLPEYIGNSSGHSVVIVRSDKGNNHIDGCIKDNVLTLEETTEDAVIESQKNLLTKKKYYNIKMFAARFLLEKVPIDKLSINITIQEIKKLPGIIKELVKIKSYK